MSFEVTYAEFRCCAMLITIRESLARERDAAPDSSSGHGAGTVDKGPALSMRARMPVMI